MLKIFGAAVAAVAMATAANAIVTVSSTDGPDTYAGPVLFDFDTPATTPTITGNYQIVSGSIGGVAANPLGNPTAYLSVPEDLVNTPLAATVSLGAGYKQLSFYWGSIDSYNSVEFFNGATSLGVVTGTTAGVNAPADGSQGLPTNNRRVNFTFGGATADSFVLTSSQFAFEVDTIGSAVPEPSTWAMLIGGMGLVGASMRRRRTLTSVAA